MAHRRSSAERRTGGAQRGLTSTVRLQAVPRPNSPAARSARRGSGANGATLAHWTVRLFARLDSADIARGALGAFRRSQRAQARCAYGSPSSRSSPYPSHPDVLATAGPASRHLPELLSTSFQPDAWRRRHHFRSSTLNSVGHTEGGRPAARGLLLRLEAAMTRKPLPGNARNRVDLGPCCARRPAAAARMCASNCGATTGQLFDFVAALNGEWPARDAAHVLGRFQFLVSAHHSMPRFSA